MIKASPKLARLEVEMIEALYGAMDVFSEAYSIRVDGEGRGVGDSEGIRVVPKKDGTGIDVYVEAGLERGRVHIPVVISRDGVVDRITNDFHIGAGARVVIMAGCGIHSDAKHITQHDGVHRFFVEAGAEVRYVESHIGTGSDSGRRVMNPVSEILLGAGSLFEMDTTQIRGVSRSRRITTVKVGDGAKLAVREKILTEKDERTKTEFRINLDGRESRASISSRAVAGGESIQEFRAIINGDNRCRGHSECDGIISGEAKIIAIPEVRANHSEAELVHEAAIGRIQGDQVIKLMSLGLSRKEAEEKIIDGFLR